MADLANPVVTVAYQCGCSFTDDTELGGGMRFRWGGDETRVFQTRQALADAKTAAAKRAVLTAELARTTDALKPSRAALEAKATPDDVYVALLERPASEVAQEVADGVRVSRPPAACPRHGRPAEHVHASYLNPADQPAEAKAVAAMAEKP